MSDATPDAVTAAVNTQLYPAAVASPIQLFVVALTCAHAPPWPLLLPVQNAAAAAMGAQKPVQPACVVVASAGVPGLAHVP